MRDRRPPSPALLVLGTLAVVGVLGSVVWPWDHTVHAEIIADAPPSLAHPLGTSRLGHDVLGQVLRGLVQSLRVAVVAGTLGTACGTVVGAIAGWHGGHVDAVVMRLVDVVLVLPLLVLAVALAGPDTTWLDTAVVVGLLGAAGVARVIRIEVRTAASRQWIEAAVGFGAAPAWVLRRHVLPHVRGTIAVAASGLAAAAVGVEATLSYLGVGIQVPDTSLGLLVARNHPALFTRPWLVLAPAAVLVTVVVALQAAGDRQRSFSPHQSGAGGPVRGPSRPTSPGRGCR